MRISVGVGVTVAVSVGVGHEFYYKDSTLGTILSHNTILTYYDIINKFILMLIKIQQQR